MYANVFPSVYSVWGLQSAKAKLSSFAHITRASREKADKFELCNYASLRIL